MKYLIFFIFFSFQANAYFKSAQELASQITPTDSSENSLRAYGLAIGYIQGVLDTQYNEACLPEAFTINQSMEMYKTFIADKPKRWHEPASILFLEMLSSNFPCGSGIDIGNLNFDKLTCRQFNMEGDYYQVIGAPPPEKISNFDLSDIQTEVINQVQVDSRITDLYISKYTYLYGNDALNALLEAGNIGSKFYSVFNDLRIINTKLECTNYQDRLFIDAYAEAMAKSMKSAIDLKASETK